MHEAAVSTPHTDLEQKLLCPSPLSSRPVNWHRARTQEVSDGLTDGWMGGWRVMGGPGQPHLLPFQGT